MSKKIQLVGVLDLPKSDWNQTDETKIDYIKNKPELAPVTTSGSFNDLKHQPSVMFTVTDDGVLCMNMMYVHEDANVTYMDETGSTILYSETLSNCGFAKNPIDNGDIYAPTKESTAQYHYTFDGWSLTPGGSSNDGALMNINTNRTVYAAFTGTIRSYTVTFKNDDDTILHTETVQYGENATYSTVPTSSNGADYMFVGWSNPTENIIGDVVCVAQYMYSVREMDNMSWEEISALSTSGDAANYFTVGDAKAVTLNGTVGTLALNNQTYYVYVLGFDHNSAYEGNGITFGCFKTEKTDGINVALCDSSYSSSNTSGSKLFNMNHWCSYNYGGWAGCDLRYDILGSTDAAPSGYGAAKSTSVVGYDATVTCATNPVANTLMAALPADLRAVMKPITKYADGKGNSSNVATNVIVTVDYLPLLAEFEIFGARSYANQYEQNKQKQYDYFAAGNSKIKYKHSATGTKCYWWGRSAYYSNSGFFCYVYAAGGTSGDYARYSYGLAPAFKV